MKVKSVQEQFGPAAWDYAQSSVHARGASLDRLIAISSPEPTWRVLDIATGAGHTAHAVAANVNSVLALDRTGEMLAVARELSHQKGLNNIKYLMADAESLPFVAQSMDLVTCRIAAHHFPNPMRYVLESARLLRQGGVFALVDNVVPSTNRATTKKKLAAAGSYLNAFERLRDPSHVRALSRDEWLEMLCSAGLRPVHQETLTKEIELLDWSARMSVSSDTLIRLRVMLHQAPEAVKAFINPRFEGQDVTFDLTELLLIAVKE